MLTTVDPHIERRFRDGLKAPLSWHPTEGGKRSFVCFEDELVEDLGPDADGTRFNMIAERMLSGRYYPRDAVQFYGRFQDENRPLRPGDRVQQRAPILPFWDGLVAWSMAEIFVAEKSDSTCSIGYVTTRKHHGRGIWRADLVLANGHLTLTVKSNQFNATILLASALIMMLSLLPIPDIALQSLLVQVRVRSPASSGRLLWAEWATCKGQYLRLSGFRRKCA